MKEHQILWIAYILFAAFILVLLITNIKDMYTGKKLTKEFLARDIGLIVESAYIGNGDLKVDYNLGQTYSIKIENGVLLLRENVQSSYGSYLIAENRENLELNCDKSNELVILNRNGIEIRCELI